MTKAPYRVKVEVRRANSVGNQHFYYRIKSYGNFKILAHSEQYTTMRAVLRSARIATGGGPDVQLEYAPGIKGKKRVVVPFDMAQ